MTPTPNTGLKEAVERAIWNEVFYHPRINFENAHLYTHDEVNRTWADARQLVSDAAQAVLSALPPVVEAPGDQEGELERYAALGRSCEANGLAGFGHNGDPDAMWFQPPDDIIAENAVERYIAAWNRRPSPEPEPVQGEARSAVRAALEFYRDNWDWFPGDGEQPNAVDVGSLPTFYEAEPNAALKADEGKRATEALAALSEPVQELQGVDLDWLRSLKDSGHCGEGTFERQQRDRHNDRIDRLLRALSSPEPGGSEFVRVPREPTAEMAEAGSACTRGDTNECYPTDAAQIYRAMIKASQGSVTATRSEGGEAP